MLYQARIMCQWGFHGCCWETFYIFAYCGLVRNPHLTAKFSIFAPLQTPTKVFPNAIAEHVIAPLPGTHVHLDRRPAGEIDKLPEGIASFCKAFEGVACVGPWDFPAVAGRFRISCWLVQGQVASIYPVCLSVFFFRLCFLALRDAKSIQLMAPKPLALVSSWQNQDSNSNCNAIPEV